MSSLPSRIDRRKFWRRPMIWIAIPMFLCGAAASGLGLREWWSANAVRDELARLRTAGIPVDNATLEVNFIANTSSEGTVAWSEISSLVGNVWSRTLEPSELFRDPTSLSLQPDAYWKDETLIAEYLSKMQPVLELIHSAAVHPTPVWQPIHFNGFATTLAPVQTSRSILRLLQLDFRYAVRIRDRERALQNLRSMHATSEAFNWRNALVVELVYYAGLDIRRQLIRESMQADLWTRDDLLQLREFVGESLDVEELWPKLVASERAMALAWLYDLQTTDSLGERSAIATWLYAFPSIRWQYLQDTARMEAIADRGFETFIYHCRKIDYAELSFLTREISPAYESLANTLVKQEDMRRLSLTALAVKEFQLENDAWPAQLIQLVGKSRLGITSRELHSVDTGPWGYRVEKDAAYLLDRLSHVERSGLSESEAEADVWQLQIR